MQETKQRRVIRDCIASKKFTNTESELSIAGRWLGLSYMYRQCSPACNWHVLHTLHTDETVAVKMRQLQTFHDLPVQEQVSDIYTVGYYFCLTILTGRGSVGDNLQSRCQQQISGFREDDPGLRIGQSLTILSSDWLRDTSNWYQDLEKWEEERRGKMR